MLLAVFGQAFDRDAFAWRDRPALVLALCGLSIDGDVAALDEVAGSLAGQAQRASEKNIQPGAGSAGLGRAGP